MTSLATYAPGEGEFTPTVNDHAVGNYARISGGLVSGNRIAFTQPAYPIDAKRAHESGTVILRALIGRDGHIRRLTPMSATDSEFAISAIAAVRKWAYKPYLLNGEPTEVDTTITVNYAINGLQH